MASATHADVTLYRRLLRLARPYWLHITGIFLLGLLASPLTLLTPLPLQIAVDSVVGSHDVPGFLAVLLPAGATRSRTTALILAAALFVAVALLSQFQQLSSAVLSAYTGERLVLNFRTQLFRHVQRLSLSYHDSTGTSVYSSDSSLPVFRRALQLPAGHRHPSGPLGISATSAGHILVADARGNRVLVVQVSL